MTPAEYMRDAMECVRQKDLIGARTHAERGLKAYPADPGLLGLAALAALQSGDAESGKALLRRQLAVTPQDKAARTNLAMALLRGGEHAEALAVARDHGDHPRLARIAAFLLQDAGEIGAAIRAYRVTLEADVRDPETWNNFANCLVQTGDLPNAVKSFQNAINYDSNPPAEVFVNLCDALLKLDNREGRLHAAREAVRRYPDHARARLELGLAEAAAGHTEDALATLARAAEVEAQVGGAVLEYGLLLENTNRLDELDALVARYDGPDAPAELRFLKAWALRRRDRFAEAAVLAADIPKTISPLRAAQLRGEIAERLGDTDAAFAAFERMNREVVAASPPLEGPTFRQRIESQTAAMLPPVALSGAPGSGDAQQDPAFIVGFPRSGTTLLDTLLSALPELQVFEEQPVLGRVEDAYPDLSAQSQPDTIEAARALYFSTAAQLQGDPEGRRILDKHPLHMTHMPTIQRLFPKAPVVFVQRHPCDVVLSCFMANFVMNPAMRSFTDLEEAAHTYDAVMRNWYRAQELLPLAVHTVRYESMIADLEGEMRAVLDFLGLPWREAVLDNQTSAAQRGAVRTASYAQVGEPIYSRAIARWERYRPHLEPVLPILAPWAERMGYAV